MANLISNLNIKLKKHLYMDSDTGAFRLVLMCFPAMYLAMTKVATLSTKLLHLVQERSMHMKLYFKA